MHSERVEGNDGKYWWVVTYKGHQGYIYAPLLSASRPASTATPMPTATAPHNTLPSWLDNTRLLGEYGRAFGVAPILGRLGLFDNFDELAADIQHWSDKLRPYNGGKQIRPEIHLIYGMATPCSEGGNCLSYLDDQGVDIVNDYIKPAQKRGWLVFLDSQLGRSDPMTEVNRMISKGYLKYDNVEVALDPEFHSVPGYDVPGIPIGHIEAAQVNQVQSRLSDYVRSNKLSHRKILLIHSFNDDMIRNKTTVRLYTNVDLVINADGLGTPYAKVSKYNVITSSSLYPFIHYRGIKLFPQGPSTTEGHYDTPMMSMQQALGLEAVPGGRRIETPPDVIIMT